MDIYNAVLRAKALSTNTKTALDIIFLAKKILYYEKDVNDNTFYIIRGLCRRTVFECTKRRISCKLKNE